MEIDGENFRPEELTYEALKLSNHNHKKIELDTLTKKIFTLDR